MRLPWECHTQSQDTNPNWRHCVTGPELPFFHKRKSVLKIDQSANMPWHKLSMGDASSCSSAPGGGRYRLFEGRGWLLKWLNDSHKFVFFFPGDPPVVADHFYPVKVLLTFGNVTRFAIIKLTTKKCTFWCCSLTKRVAFWDLLLSERYIGAEIRGRRSVLRLWWVLNKPVGAMNTF